MTAMSHDVVAIDGHVHLREPKHDADALHAAARNFARWSAVPSRVGVLMLAEAAGEDAFSRLRSGTGPSGRLPRRATSEPESLWFEVTGWRLLVVAGRQIVTQEGLEVLALATRQPFRDGMPLNDVLAEVRSADAVAVLPWGCGKWLGARGRLVAQALLDEGEGRLLLGDNGNRPRVWHEPRLSRGRSVVRGTDPLPLPGQWQQVGRFGSIVPLMPGVDRPAADLRRALRDRAVVLRPFGPHERFSRFLLGQARLRLGRPARFRTAAS